MDFVPTFSITTLCYLCKIGKCICILRRILRDSEPDDEFLLEAAELYDRLGLSWDAKNVRERITQ